MLDLDKIYCRLQEQLNILHYWDILWENARLFLVYYRLHRDAIVAGSRKGVISKFALHEVKSDKTIRCIIVAFNSESIFFVRVVDKDDKKTSFSFRPLYKYNISDGRYSLHWTKFDLVDLTIHRLAQKLHISICLMWNWYSFVKSQPNFIIFGTLTPDRFQTKQCIYCPQHLLRVFILSCRNNIVRFLCRLRWNLLMDYFGKRLNSVNHTKLFWSD